jgi:hypothetical protein|tara:strand:- start:97 stop:309 length:213 start_codon:yes stop_codon:yes gene_type:complete
MDDILNKIRVSQEKDLIVDYEKTVNRALDYLVSIEGIEDEKIDQIREFLTRLIDEEIDFLVRNPEDYFHS